MARKKSRSRRPTTHIISGPSKSRSSGPASARLSTHKKRSAWFQARAAWPFREADGDLLVAEAHRRIPAARVPAANQWELMGPTNIGGRCTAVVAHPGDPDQLWIGAAGGGVWKSTDGGASWTSLWHNQSSLNVGSLALDPKNPKIVYCGTGEANLSADSYPGVGIYRSTNGGTSWKIWASAAKFDLPRRIGAISIDPFDSNHIRIGGVTHMEGGPSGMYVTRDRGKTWARETFVSTFGYRCHAISFHPTRQGVIFATVTEQGSRNGIWRTTDGGATWRQLKNGLPAPDRMDRTSLAIAPSQPDTIYALASERDLVLGVFVSRNMGGSWTDVAGNHFSDEGQMSYGNTIVVHPTDPNHVLCGGVDLHLTTNGGASWKRVSRWDARRGTASYAHADHHCLLMPAATPGRVYDANDGGMDRSDNGGTAWKNCSNGLAVTMYYDLDVAPSDPRTFGGGTQDNGTNLTVTGSASDHFEILGGDGGWMVYHPSNASTVYASYYNMNIYRFSAGGYADVSPPADENEKGSVWMCYITIDPNNPQTVFTGSSRVWRTKNAGGTWRPVSAALDGSTLTAIEIALANSMNIFVGTEKGSFFRSLDGGNTWSGNLAGSQMSGRTITRLETHPQDGNTIFATTAGTGRSHVFMSKDGGTSWSDIDGGQLPDSPFHAIVCIPEDPRTLVVCGDAGIFMTRNSGKEWTSLKRNLPNVMTVDLVYHQGQGAIYVATYGRSIWRIKIR